MPARSRSSGVLVGAALLAVALFVHLGAGTWLVVNGARRLGPAGVTAVLATAVLAHVVAILRLRRLRAARRR